jgi:hypothetical protein
VHYPCCGYPGLPVCRYHGVVLQPNLPCANNVGLAPALSDGDVRTVRYIYGRLLTSGPGAVSWGPGRIDVFAMHGANHLQRITFDGTWHNWEYILPTGPGLSSDPDVCSMGPNHLDVFVRGTDGALWHQWFDGTTWSGWGSLF